MQKTQVRSQGLGGPLKKGKATHSRILGDSLVAQMVKNLPAMQEIQVRYPGHGRSPGEGKGDPLQYSCLENSVGREAWQFMGSQSVRHDQATNSAFKRATEILSST